MRVTCPNCQCKGLIDTAPLLSKARVTCARCGAAYEALLVDGAIETVLPAGPAEARASELSAEPQPQEAMLVPVDADEVLALPQEFEHVAPADEPAAVLEILAPAPAEQTIEATKVELPAPAQVAAAPAGPDGHDADPLADSGTFKMPAEYQPQFSRTDLVRHAEQDKYSLGVRLMRVSPLWLLVCGLAFIGLVVALNGLTGSAEQVNSASSLAARGSASGNQATNQSARNAAPDQTARTLSAAATVSKPERARETEQPSTAQTNVAAQPQQVAAVQPTPQAETPRKQVEAKPAPAPPVAAQAEGDGKFTLQVGSFNNPVEAHEHAAHLQAAGFTARVVAVELPGRGTWYRVQTGRFGDRAEAARAGSQLRAKGAAESFIVAEVAAH